MATSMRWINEHNQGQEWFLAEKMMQDALAMGGSVRRVVMPHDYPEELVEAFHIFHDVPVFTDYDKRRISVLWFQ